MNINGYNGLRKKPTYNVLIDYIQNKQPTIKYPNRLATQIMNSKELTKLDDLGMGGIEEQEENIAKEKQRVILIQQQAEHEGTTAKNLISMRTKPRISKAQRKQNNNVFSSDTAQDPDTQTTYAYTSHEPEIFDITLDDDVDDYMADVEEMIAEEETKKYQKKII